MKKKFIVLSCCGLLLISFVTFAIYITLNATTTDNSDDNSIDKTLFYEFSSYPKEITVSNSSEEFTLDCTNSDNFSIDKLSGIPINQSFCKQLYEHSKTLSAIKVFSRNDEEDYGFADKSASIVFFYR